MMIERWFCFEEENGDCGNCALMQWVVNGYMLND